MGLLLAQAAPAAAPAICLVQGGNTFGDGDCNRVSQTGYTSGSHSILLGNRWLNNVPRRHNSGEHMYEAGEATGHGPVTRAAGASPTIEGAPFEGKKLRGEYLLVLDGPGLGQYRRVVSNTANTLTLAPPWDGLPDSTTSVMTGKALVETLWIENEEENTANWTGLWGNNFGRAVDEAQQLSRADTRKSWSVKEGQDVIYFNIQPERSEADLATARAEIPPVHYTPPADRWDALPVSRARLAEKGGTWRVVMLGDSIVNDTWRSRFSESLQARLRHTRLELTAVVAGGKGCWWYAQQGRVSRHVAPLQPDLLIIGGISHGNDLDAVRSVMREIRVTRPVDVLLCTGPFGAVDPTDDANWAAERATPDKAWHVRLAGLAREEKAAFLDLQLLWGEYVRARGKPLAWFKRDSVHANARGEAVLGRFMTEYLTP